MLLCRSIMFNQHPTSDAARQHPGITWPSYSGSLNLMKHRLVKTFLYWWGASTIHLSITLHIDPAIGCYSKMNDYNNDYWMLCFFSTCLPSPNLVREAVKRCQNGIRSQEHRQPYGSIQRNHSKGHLNYRWTEWSLRLCICTFRRWTISTGHWF